MVERAGGGMVVDGTGGLASADFTTRATRRVKGTTTKLVIIRPYFFVASKKKTAAAMRRCRLGSLGPRRDRSTGHFPTIKRQRCVLLSYPARKAVNSHIRKIKKALGSTSTKGDCDRKIFSLASGFHLDALRARIDSINSQFYFQYQISTNRCSLFLFVFPNFER